MEIAAPPRPTQRRSHVKGTDEIAEKAPMFRQFCAECPRNGRFASIAAFTSSPDYQLHYYEPTHCIHNVNDRFDYTDIMYSNMCQHSDRVK